MVCLNGLARRFGPAVDWAKLGAVLVSLVVLACAALCGAGALAFSWSRRLEPEPLTGEAEQRWFLARLCHHPRVVRFVRQRLDPERFAGLSLTLAFVVALAAAFVVGAVLDLLQRNPSVEAADRWVARWGVDHASSSAVRVLQWWTNLGTAAVVLPVVAVVGLLSWRRSHRWAPLLFMVIASTGASALSTIVKQVVDRQRPDVIHLTSYGGPSFPSGHTVYAAAGWAAIALVVSRHRPRAQRRAAMGVAVFIAVGVATSRALLGVHWLTDVIAGLALGWGWFLVCAIVWGGRRQRPGVMAEQLGASPGVTPRQ
jgi:membrane-associated phospholipid phosphatase